ncbi:hypothetical protein C8R46DRAFT_1042009 [Mycena filopes]|nr:hypothetical protein C8R46DRAFT_1042009 [Mycena filopes]
MPSDARDKAALTPTEPARHSLPAQSDLGPPSVPLVDRAILQKLADMEIYPDPDERPYFASSLNRPPMVTRIPEARMPFGPPPPPDICGSSPCRFLLPLRIGEQESKARIHFMELLQLAQSLDRILVLPNVGKSRMGACFKEDFEMYYDLERLTDEFPVAAGRVATMKVDLFRRWLDAAQGPSAQLAFVSVKQELDSLNAPTTFSNEDLSIRVGSTNKMELPGCFSKFHALRLDAHAPLHIHLKQPAPARPIAPAIIDALTRPEIQAAASASASSASDSPSDPDVLVLSYDLRLPIFPPSPLRPQLHYAPRLHALAAALAPPLPYTMVHWRMESVPPAALPACAHALVDTLANRLPLDPGVVWFASDYPHAVHRSAPPGVDYGSMNSDGVQTKAKSRTFRDVGPLHAEAVGILGDALAEGGELEGWKVVELTEARLAGLQDHDEWGPELLADAGVRAIVDKLIGMRATLFVIDGRRAVFDRRDDEHELQNVVELFG